jgi:hypothetical protein
MPDLFAACFDFTVVVREGAIAGMYGLCSESRCRRNIFGQRLYFPLRASGELWQNILVQNYFGGGAFISFDEAQDNNSMSSKKEQRARSAAISRDTNETKIVLAINLDGGEFPDNTDSKLTQGVDGHATQVSQSQIISINSGIGFLDHMLHALAKHSGWSLALICKGDLHSEEFVFL